MIEDLKELITTIDQSVNVSNFTTADQLIMELEYLEGDCSKKIANHNGLILGFLENRMG